jgi:F-type H+-transporting ATPase subunit k
MGILGGLFAGIYSATSGPKRPAAADNTPPINASSSDEADFIKCANSCPRCEKHTLTSTQEVPRGAGGYREEALSGDCGGLEWMDCTTHCTYTWHRDSCSPLNRILSRTTNHTRYYLRYGMTSNHKPPYYITVHASMGWIRSGMGWALVI